MSSAVWQVLALRVAVPTHFPLGTTTPERDESDIAFAAVHQLLFRLSQVRPVGWAP
ncbi:MAG: hypothetical protein WBA81_08215 [Rhodococcus sp. (in: high G+C Gram-positive bacteria)]